MATQITPQTRALLAGRSHGICEICAAARATEASHRRPKGMGGTSLASIHGAAWLIHACHDCHQGPRGIESDRDRARTLGWLLGPAEDPATTPCWLRTVNGSGWWVLTDDGNYHSATVSDQMHTLSPANVI